MTSGINSAQLGELQQSLHTVHRYAVCGATEFFLVNTHCRALFECTPHLNRRRIITRQCADTVHWFSLCVSKVQFSHACLHNAWLKGAWDIQRSTSLPPWHPCSLVPCLAPDQVIADGSPPGGGGGSFGALPSGGRSWSTLPPTTICTSHPTPRFWTLHTFCYKKWLLAIVVCALLRGGSSAGPCSASTKPRTLCAPVQIHLQPMI